MALTYTAIETVTLSSAQSSIEFTSIPQTYTDLAILYSLRSNRASQVNSSGRVLFNGSTSNYSYREIVGTGSAVGNNSGSNGALIYIPASTATGSTFGNALVYIPNYAGSNNKSYSVDFVAENNAINIDGQGLSVGLWSDSSAITSVKVEEANGANFVQYSTATLYGIKNTV